MFMVAGCDTVTEVFNGLEKINFDSVIHIIGLHIGKQRTATQPL